MNAPAVSLVGIGRRYGSFAAVKDVSFELHAGEVLALLGPNGAGKTTLMKMILGLARPTSGEVRVFGGSPGSPEIRRKLGFLPENVALNPALTGRELLRFYARLKGVAKGEIGTLLERVGLGAAADRRVGTYSKGMRQRLGLAQALLGKPRLLMLDEPTSGLDPILRQQFYEIIRELKAGGTAVMLSSHVLTELEARTDRVAILGGGELRAVGTLDDLRLRAGLPVRIRVRAASSVLDAMRDELDGRRINGHAVELVCPPGEKVALLRRITALPVAIDDLELAVPGLEDLYVHFGGPAGPAGDRP